MKRSSRVRLEDLRQASRLLGEMHALKQDPQAQMLYLLDGVARLANADLSFFGVFADYLPNHVVRPLRGESGSNRDAGMEGYVQRFMERASMDGDCMVDLSVDRMERQVSVSLRQHWGPDDFARRYPNLRDLLRSLSFGDAMTSHWREDNGRDIWGFSLHRMDRQVFGRRDMQLMEFIVGELAYLRDCGVFVPTQRPQVLPPRQQQIIGLLLAGKTPKRISCELDLSIHTVREHLQAIYRRFGVSGRDELLIRLLKTPAPPQRPKVSPPPIPPVERA